MKMLNSLNHILVIIFNQTAVTNIYFGSYFICSIQTKIVINYSIFSQVVLKLFTPSTSENIWLSKYHHYDQH